MTKPTAAEPAKTPKQLLHEDIRKHSLESNLEHYETQVSHYESAILIVDEKEAAFVDLDPEYGRLKRKALQALREGHLSALEFVRYARSRTTGPQGDM